MLTAKNYTKCKLSTGKVVWARIYNPQYVEYYYDADETKHAYKVQLSFFKKNAIQVK